MKKSSERAGCGCKRVGVGREDGVLEVQVSKFDPPPDGRHDHVYPLHDPVGPVSLPIFLVGKIPMRGYRRIHREETETVKECHILPVRKGPLGVVVKSGLGGKGTLGTWSGTTFPLRDPKGPRTLNKRLSGEEEGCV